jgi:hypothetical protein
MMTPIFLLGINARSGTNFAYQLLTLHPDIAPAAHQGEDYLLHHSDLLVQYLDTTQRQWSTRWGHLPDMKRALSRALSEGLLRYLQPASTLDGTAWLTKTPSTQNLTLFFRLFPQARLILLVRDGRDVVESGVRSGFWDYEEGFRQWRDSAARIVAFRDQHYQHADQFRIVKYEDLLDKLREVMPELLRLCQVNPDRYPYEAALDLPVFGSSTHRGTSQDIHWQPEKKDPSFQPRTRWTDWSPDLHLRYRWVCGPMAQALGYKKLEGEVGPRYYAVNARGELTQRLWQKGLLHWIRQIAR